MIPQLFSSTGSQSSTFNEAGCILAVRSIFNGVNPEPGAWSWGSHGPWEIQDSVLNIGAQRCVVQLTGQQPVTLEPGAIKIRESYSISRPQQVSRELAFGPEIPIRKVQAEFYVEQHN